MAAALFREIKAKRQLDVDPSCQRKYAVEGGRQLVVQEDPQGGVGGSIWDAALQLYKSIEAAGQRGALRGLRVIELGSGTGILGLLAACYGAAEVRLTDRFEVLGLLRLNVELNAPLLGDAAVLCGELDWGSGHEPALHPPYDLILASECIYNMQYAPALLKSINALRGPATTVLFTYASRNPDEERLWFDAAVKPSWAVTELPVPQPSPQPGDHIPPTVHLQVWQALDATKDPHTFAFTN